MSRNTMSNIDPLAVGPIEIVVSSSDELSEAYDYLSTVSGGGTILVESATESYVLWERGGYTNSGEDQPVYIKSADPDEPAIFKQIYLRDVSNIRVENVIVDSTDVKDRDAGVEDLLVQNSDNIQIVDSAFRHNADGRADDYSDAVPSLGRAFNVDDFLFSGNTINGYFHGLGVLDSTNVEISNNTLTELQGDGLRFGGVKDIDIVDNILADFYGASQTVTHSDLIQFWGTNVNQLTENVNISGNILDTGDGAASQSIFIRNERFRTEYTDNYQNIVISDNLIYNAVLHGISVADVDGLEVTNNTVLWNQGITVLAADGSESNSIPTILLRSSTDVTVTDNIAPVINYPDGSVAANNYTIDYSNPFAENYVEKHFVNAFYGGDVDLRDLRLLEDSPWSGAGADISQPQTATEEGVEALAVIQGDPGDRYVLTFDASGSLDETGKIDPSEYKAVWTFDDGTVLEGLTVTREYDNGGAHGVVLDLYKGDTLVDAIGRPFTVQTKDIFLLDFESGIDDISMNNADVSYNGDNVLVEGRDGGTGFQLGGSNKVIVSRSTQQINDLEAFGLTMDLRLDDAENSGVFMNFYQVMGLRVTSDGSVRFSMNTDQGSFAVQSDPGTMRDGDWRTIGVGYDGAEGSLALYIDGKVVDQTEAYGATPGYKNHLTLGEAFKPSLEATIDNVYMSVDPAAAGEPVVFDRPDEPEPEPDIVVPDDEAETPPEPPAAEEPEPESEPEPDVVEEPKTAPEPEPEPDVAEEPELQDDKDGGSGLASIFSFIFEFLAALFGGGSKKNDEDEVTVSQSQEHYDDVLLSDLLVETAVLDETLPETEGEDDDPLDLAA